MHTIFGYKLEEEGEEKQEQEEGKKNLRLGQQMYDDLHGRCKGCEVDHVGLEPSQLNLLQVGSSRR